MKDFVTKYVKTDPNTTPKRFRIGRHDDDRIKLVFEEQNALWPHSWRLVGSVILDDEDTFGYLDVAGVRI